jgi:hypothetical protein
MDFDSKKVINETVQELADRYSTMFNPTSRCRPPHLHADTLREDLFSVCKCMFTGVTMTMCDNDPPHALDVICFLRFYVS